MTIKKYIIVSLVGITILAVGAFVLYGVQKVKAACGSGYGYCTTLTIDHTKVPNTDQTNFTVLFSTTTMASIKTTGSGGNVVNTVAFNGQTVAADLVFSTSTDCSGLMSWDVEHYVGTTGEIQAWVKIPTLSHTVDTTLTMCWGNASVSAYQGGSVGTAWDSNYKAIWHLQDGSTLNLNSATGSNNATNSGATATSGQIDGAANINGGTNYIDAGNSTDWNFGTGDFTASFWVNIPSQIGYEAFLSDAAYSSGWTGFHFELSGDGTGKTWYSAQFDIAGTWVASAAAMSTGVWHHVVGVRASGVQYIYLDNVATSTPNTLNATANRNLFIGKNNDGTYPRNITGSMDDVRISNSARSADWIATEYNNESSPSTFITVGPIQTGGGGSPTTTPEVLINAVMIVK